MIKCCRRGIKHFSTQSYRKIINASIWYYFTRTAGVFSCFILSVIGSEGKTANHVPVCKSRLLFGIKKGWSMLNWIGFHHIFFQSNEIKWKWRHSDVLSSVRSSLYRVLGSSRPSLWEAEENSRTFDSTHFRSLLKVQNKNTEFYKKQSCEKNWRILS